MTYLIVHLNHILLRGLGTPAAVVKVLRGLEQEQNNSLHTQCNIINKLEKIRGIVEIDINKILCFRVWEPRFIQMIHRLPSNFSSTHNECDITA